MSYLRIGVGGARGSIARAGLPLAIIRLTGPQFPWGTLPINALGCFIIGGFSILTLPTLELLRGGQPGQALANIGLLALCLVAVAAGYSEAMSLNQRPHIEARLLMAPTAADPDRLEGAPGGLPAAAELFAFRNGSLFNAAPASARVERSGLQRGEGAVTPREAMETAWLRHKAVEAL